MTLNVTKHCAFSEKECKAKTYMEHLFSTKFLLWQFLYWLFLTTLKFYNLKSWFSPVQLSSVAQLGPTLCDPKDSSMPGLPVHHQLPELTQTQVHRVGEAIQPFHPLLSPSPPALNLSQHQGLFQRGQFFTSCGQSIGVSASASVLPMNIQDWFPLGLTGMIFLQSNGLSRVFSNTTVQNHQLFGTQLSL